MIDILREAYQTFYDLPAKSVEQFDVMASCAPLIRYNNPVVLPIEDLRVFVREFNEAFEGCCETQRQKDALALLALVD